jgi:hypothetical protein
MLSGEIQRDAKAKLTAFRADIGVKYIQQINILSVMGLWGFGISLILEVIGICLICNGSIALGVGLVIGVSAALTQIFILLVKILEVFTKIFPVLE